MPEFVDYFQLFDLVYFVFDVVLIVAINKHAWYGNWIKRNLSCLEKNLVNTIDVFDDIGMLDILIEIILQERENLVIDTNVAIPMKELGKLGWIDR